MSLVDDIPADDVVELTAAIARAFRTEGCEPTCHCCNKAIAIGRKFKLAFIPIPPANCSQFATKPEGNDVMLCYRCTPAKLVVELEKRARARARERAGRGFIREHQP